MSPQRRSTQNNIVGPNSSNSEDDSEKIRIDNLHMYRNDLDSLADLAKIDPRLARAVVKQKDHENERENVSYRFGIVATSLLLGLGLVMLTVLLVFVGPLGTLLSIFVILALALAIRVILTGEWSETSWIGAGLSHLARILGSKPDPVDPARTRKLLGC